MIDSKTISYLKDSVLCGASAGGTLEVLDDSAILDNPTEDTALKVFVSIFSAFVVPAVRKWLRKRKERRAQKRKAQQYNTDRVNY